MLKYKYKPELSKKAFWDVAFRDLDYEKNAEYIISRVFDYGTLDDIGELLVCYGDKNVKNVLINTRYLDGFGREMANYIFKLKSMDFNLKI